MFFSLWIKYHKHLPSTPVLHQVLPLAKILYFKGVKKMKRIFKREEPKVSFDEWYSRRKPIKKQLCEQIPIVLWIVVCIFLALFATFLFFGKYAYSYSEDTYNIIKEAIKANIRPDERPDLLAIRVQRHWYCFWGRKQFYPNCMHHQKRLLQSGRYSKA